MKNFSLLKKLSVSLATIAIGMLIYSGTTYAAVNTDNHNLNHSDSSQSHDVHEKTTKSDSDSSQSHDVHEKTTKSDSDSDSDSDIHHCSKHPKCKSKGDDCNNNVITKAPTTPIAPTASVTSLPNTGPGNLIGIFAIVTVIGAIAHRIYTKRVFAKS